MKIEYCYVVTVREIKTIGDKPTGVEKRKVVSVGRAWVTVEDFDGGALRVPVSRCFTNSEQAKAYYEELREKWIERLKQEISFVKAKLVVVDKSGTPTDHTNSF